MWLCHIVQQHLGGTQIGRFEAFGEPAIHRTEEFTSSVGAVSAPPEPGEAGGRAQFPAQGSLPVRPIERLPKLVFGRRRSTGVAPQEKELALDAQQLGVSPFSAHPLRWFFANRAWSNPERLLLRLLTRNARFRRLRRNAE